MKQPDYTPFELADVQPDYMLLQLKKSHRILRALMFRITPWFILLSLAATYEDVAKNMPGWFYTIWAIMMGGLAIYLLIYKYTLEITLSNGTITSKVNSLYFNWNETKTLSPGDSIYVVKEQGGRSVYWAFYLHQNNTKKRILNVPIFLSENLEARNNFAEAFEHYCKIKVNLPDDKK